MNIHIADREELGKIFALRLEVFVDEQSVPLEIELDAEDGTAVHILAEEGGVAVGCARLLLSGREAHIGRLAVKRAYRGRGLGAAICRLAIDECRRRGASHILIHAQLHAVGFYERFGFRPFGTPFLEAGIEHIRMVLNV